MSSSGKILGSDLIYICRGLCFFFSTLWWVSLDFYFFFFFGLMKLRQKTNKTKKKRKKGKKRTKFLAGVSEMAKNGSERRQWSQRRTDQRWARRQWMPPLSCNQRRILHEHRILLDSRYRMNTKVCLIDFVILFRQRGWKIFRFW